MAKLNKLQLEHIESRLNKAVERKARTKVGALPEAKCTYTDEEKYNLIKSGKATLKSLVALRRELGYAYLLSAFDYPELPGAKALEAHNKKLEAARKQFQAQADKLYEKLLFLDSSEVLAELEKFCGE